MGKRQSTVGKKQSTVGKRQSTASQSRKAKSDSKKQREKGLQKISSTDSNTVITDGTASPALTWPASSRPSSRASTRQNSNSTDNDEIWQQAITMGVTVPSSPTSKSSPSSKDSGSNTNSVVGKRQSTKSNANKSVGKTQSTKSNKSVGKTKSSSTKSTHKLKKGSSSSQEDVTVESTQTGEGETVSKKKSTKVKRKQSPAPNLRDAQAVGGLNESAEAIEDFQVGGSEDPAGGQAPVQSRLSTVSKSSGKSVSKTKSTSKGGGHHPKNLKPKNQLLNLPEQKLTNLPVLPKLSALVEADDIVAATKSANSNTEGVTVQVQVQPNQSNLAVLGKKSALVESDDIVAATKSTNTKSANQLLVQPNPRNSALPEEGSDIEVTERKSKVTATAGESKTNKLQLPQQSIAILTKNSQLGERSDIEAADEKQPSSGEKQPSTGEKP